MYAGPFDAMKKIYGQYGIAGIYKGQVVTLWREAVGYGIYFWAYEKLMQREMARKGIRRDQVNPANAVLFGAAAGYAVCAPLFSPFLSFLSAPALLSPVSIIRTLIQLVTPPRASRAHTHHTTPRHIPTPYPTTRRCYATHTHTAVGRHLPHRHDQVPHADGWLLCQGWAKIQVDPGLRPHRLADRGPPRVYARP